MEQAIRHCELGLGMWEFASNDRGAEPDVVMACAGDVPTLETLAAVDWLRKHIPDLKIRVVNVVDLMALQPPASIHTAFRTTISTPFSRWTSPSFSTITAIPG